MKKLVLSLLAAQLLSGCATDPYGSSHVDSRMLPGILVGGAVGAVAGRAAGLGTVEGAAAGMVAGGVAAYATRKAVPRHRHYYKDSSGYCYFVDQTGVAHYDDPPIRC